MALGDKGVGDVSSQLGKLDFHHPFTPYDVQEEFMRTVYDVLEAGDGQIGILESPTGTVSSQVGVSRSCSRFCVSGTIGGLLIQLREAQSQGNEHCDSEEAQLTNVRANRCL